MSTTYQPDLVGRDAPDPYASPFRGRRHAGAASSVEAAGTAPPRALFLTWGSFSHINRNLLPALRGHWPGVEFDSLDLADAMRGNYPLLARCLVGAAREYGPSTLRSKSTLRYRMLRSVAFTRAAQRLIERHCRGRRYAFSIQTQSLFNGAQPGWPHYLYTDHAARARDFSHEAEDPGPPSQRWLEAERGFYADADHVFTFGQKIADMVVDAYGIDRDRVSAIGAGASALPDGEVDTSLDRYGRRRIVFVGVEWERKGGPDLVAAFRRLRRDLPDATLTIIGCSPDVSGDGIEVLGRLPLETLHGHYKSASCFCMPSRLEPFGVVYLEAMQFGLPIVAADVGDVGSIVADGQNGRLAPPADPEALTAALHDVLEDAERCRGFGLNSLERAPYYTWAGVAERIGARVPVAPDGTRASARKESGRDAGARDGAR